MNWEIIVILLLILGVGALHSRVKVSDVLPVVIVVTMSVGYAEPCWASRGADYQRWMMPAYGYFLGFGVLIGAVLWLIFRRGRVRLNSVMEPVSYWLRENPIAGIIISGLLLIIPLLVGFNLIDIYGDRWVWPGWILSSYFCLFPVALSAGRIRGKLLLSPTCLWGIFIIIGAIVASSWIFLILGEGGFLQGIDDIFWGNRASWGILSHPQDSLKTIWNWGNSLIFFTGIFVAVLLYMICAMGRGLWEISGLKSVILKNCKTNKNTDKECEV